MAVIIWQRVLFQIEKPERKTGIALCWALCRARHDREYF